MSNDDGFAPPPEDMSESGLGGLADEPSAPGERPTVESSGTDPLDPTQAMGTDGGAAAATPPAGTPPLDATQVTPNGPTTPPSNSVRSGADIPPVVPGVAPGATIPPGRGGVPLEEEFDDEPWYTNPRAVAAIVSGLVVLALIVLLFFLLDGDDDGAIDDLSTDPVSLVVIRSSSGGAPLDTAISVEVTAQESAPDNYVWITPSDTVAGQSATLETDATGRVEFRWGPDEDAADADWFTTVNMVEAVQPEGDRSVSGIGAECELRRGDATENLVISTDVDLGAGSGPVPGVGRYDFPNIRFRPGDRVTCTMVNQVATPAPTTVVESTTPVVETTTTVPETTTTVAETTTTAAPTTAAPTTATPTTAAPADPSLVDFLTDNGFTDFRDLLIQADLLDDVEQSDAPFTLFVATDEAVEDFLSTFDPTTTNLTDVMRSHVSFQGAFDIAELETRDEIEVEFGGPQPLNFGPTPPRVGNVDIIGGDEAVEETSPGFVYIIDAMLEPQS